MRIKIQISPCPNDTFMFDAMLNGRIDTRGLEFEAAFADIEQLNNAVIGGDIAVSKVSCAVLPELTGRYYVLDSGSALGRGNGPLLVCRKGERERIISGHNGVRLAVPGMHTTAKLLLDRFFPDIKDSTPVLFSGIASRVASGEFDAGVLIHEGRFTYKNHGLELVADLGAEWERDTSMPLPLGSIVISRSLPPEIRSAIGEILRESVRFALDNPQASQEFVLSHAQEMSPDVVRSHIQLFVNDYSVSLGIEGRKAVALLTGLEENAIFEI